MRRPASEAQREFRDRMIDAGVLVSMGVDGLLGKAQPFVLVYDALVTLVGRAGADEQPEEFRFPPVVPRSLLERTDYIRSFPDLIGSIHSFEGNDADHAALMGSVEGGDDWGSLLSSTDVVLLPATCYPLYPMVSAAGSLPSDGRTFSVLGACFRNEPSVDPARMQLFHQHEYVRVGSPEAAVNFRDRWLQRAIELFEGLGLAVISEVANDPFFGRAGRMLAANQRATALKFEILATVGDAEQPTAIASCNCHGDHLGSAFDIKTSDGDTAHSACVGFGLERIVLAMFAAHGSVLARWPATVRDRLWP